MSPNFYPREDMIDYPCSQIWAEHYADQGMTPGYPLQMYQSPQVIGLQSQVEALEDRLKEMASAKNWFPPGLYDKYQQLMARQTYLQTQIDEIKGRKKIKKHIGAVEL